MFGADGAWGELEGLSCVAGGECEGEKVTHVKVLKEDHQLGWGRCRSCEPMLPLMRRTWRTHLTS